MHLISNLYRSVRLWCGIVGRVNQAEYRTGPLLALKIVRIMW